MWLILAVIELEKELLPTDSERKLRLWLSRPEADTLRRVVVSECQFAQAAALRRALTAQKGDASDLLLQDEMRQASRYSAFLEILDALSVQPINEPFQFARLKPLTPIIHKHHEQSNDGSVD